MILKTISHLISLSNFFALEQQDSMSITSTGIYLSFMFFLELDTVSVRGSSEVRLAKAQYKHAKGDPKPTTMALHLVDTLFDQETNEVHGSWHKGICCSGLSDYFYS